jgi:hypothetical protein
MAWKQLVLACVAAGVVGFFALGGGGCGMSHGSRDHRTDARDLDSRSRVTSPPLAGPMGDPGSPERAQGFAGKQEASAAQHAGQDSGGNQTGRQRHRHSC